MRIVIDGRMLGWTGVGRVTRHLLDELQALDNKNDYIVLLLQTDFNKWQPKKPNFTKMTADFLPYSKAEQVGFRDFLNKLKPDLVHFLAPNQPILYKGKKVTTINDLTLADYKNIRGNSLSYEVKYRVFRYIIKKSIQSSNQIITISNYVKNQIEQRYKKPATKITVTYPSAEKLAARAKLYNIRGDYLLYVGNAYPYKNLKNLVVAVSLLKQTPNIKLVLVGEKEYFYNQLEDFINQKNIKNVLLTGYVPDSQLVWLYQHAAAFVFPSLSEGFGLPGLEAMYYDLPVVVSNTSCMPEVYGSAAVYFDPYDINDITNKLEAILNSSNLRQGLIKQGRKQIKRYSWHKMAQATLRVYERVLDNKL